VIKSAVMIAGTLEMNDRNFIWIWCFGKYSAFMLVILYGHEKKTGEMFWFDVSLKFD
jgi:hypothetical protein